jgi:hypothetical protein
LQQLNIKPGDIFSAGVFDNSLRGAQLKDEIRWNWALTAGR